ncbi:MAG: hypothetical protein A2X23_13115 [Chloroflexi bacterium GWC2_73_18]|nr:MAG: hypothetical protein A2X23_13115 [Chloroflexi bacterium GWC2_73_18]
MSPVVIVIAAAVAVSIVLIAIGFASSQPVDPVQARLSQLGTMQARNLEELELQQPFLERTIRPLIGRVSNAASRLTNASASDRMEKRLALAGNPGGLRTLDYTGLRLIAAIAGGLGGGVIGLFLLGGIAGGLVAAVIGAIIGWMAPSIWLGRRIRARQRAILLQIPDALDLLTISVRAGLGFDAALGKVVEKLHGPLSDEFRRALAEVRVGRLRREALRDVVARTEVPALANFIGAVIQAEQLGVAISKVLQVQSEQLRIERRQRAEEMAAKAPIKMLFPLVGCIFPSMFIVILGPALIRIMVSLGSR